RLQPRGPRAAPPARPAAAPRAPEPFQVLGMLHAPEPDVFPEAELVLVEVLEDDADAPAERLLVPGPEIPPVEQDAALGRFVEAGGQVDESRLFGAVLPPPPPALPARNGERDVAPRPPPRPPMTHTPAL